MPSRVGKVATVRLRRADLSFRWASSGRSAHLVLAELISTTNRPTPHAITSRKGRHCQAEAGIPQLPMGEQWQERAPGRGGAHRHYKRANTVARNGPAASHSNNHKVRRPPGRGIAENSRPPSLSRSSSRLWFVTRTKAGTGSQRAVGRAGKL